MDSLYPSYPSIDSSLRDLKNWGFQPSTAIDVGADHGEWTKMFKNIYPDSKVLMIEAQDSKTQILQKVCSSFSGDVAFEISLLGARDGEKMHFVEMETGSSVFEESSSYKRTSIKKSCSLDSLLLDYPSFQKVDFLKLDVQGYELEVLKGASRLLQQTHHFILMETSLIPVNKGCPLIADVMKFMSEKDFRLLDFCSLIRRKDGALWLTDLLFIRNDSALMPKPFLDSQNWM